ncbi:MAG: DUF4926 domain-containing protein [Rubrobacter sp.]|jgi:hypothetical protein|nr:DUF4926 domain-containing protein [Rubrobacter sp.]
MISELDRVALAKDLLEEGLKEGDVGTVVHVYRGGAAYEVEFVTFSGESLGVFTVEAEAVRPVG